MMVTIRVDKPFCKCSPLDQLGWDIKQETIFVLCKGCGKEHKFKRDDLKAQIVVLTALKGGKVIEFPVMEGII